jgi:hypothetical protein
MEPPAKLGVLRKFAAGTDDILSCDIFIFKIM